MENAERVLLNRGVFRPFTVDSSVGFLAPDNLFTEPEHSSMCCGTQEIVSSLEQDRLFHPMTVTPFRGLVACWSHPPVPSYPGRSLLYTYYRLLGFGNQVFFNGSLSC